MIEISDQKQCKDVVKIWYEFYMNFNDDNFQHAELAFANNNFENYEDIFAANVNWVKEILERGITPEEILMYMPNAGRYVKIFQTGISEYVN